MSTNDQTQGPGIDPAASSQISGAPTGPVKRKWDPKGKRNLMYVGGVLTVTLLLLILIFASGNSEPSKPSSIPLPGNANAPGVIGAEDRQAHGSAEQARLEQANRGGQSAVERPLDPGTPEPESRPVAPRPTGDGPVYHETSSQPAPQPAKPAVDEARLKGFSDQVASQMKSWGLNDTSQSRSYSRPSRPSEVQQAGASVATQAAQVAGQDDAIVVQPYVTTEAAELISTFDSDHPGTVRARILTGPIAGAVLTGAAKRIGDGVQLSFKVATLKGRPFKIEAIGVDEQTASDIVEGKYNGRYAQRFVFPVIAEGVKAYASARAQTGTAVVIVGGGFGGTAAQQTPPPTVEQARSAMEAAVADRTARALAQENIQSQVVLPMKKTIGVMFVEPIFQSDLSNSTKK